MRRAVSSCSTLLCLLIVRETSLWPRSSMLPSPNVMLQSAYIIPTSLATPFARPLPDNMYIRLTHAHRSRPPAEAKWQLNSSRTTSSCLNHSRTYSPRHPRPPLSTMYLAYKALKKRRQRRNGELQDIKEDSTMHLQVAAESDNRRASNAAGTGERSELSVYTGPNRVDTLNEE